MTYTAKMPAHPVRFTKTPRAVDADYMDCSWSELFDAASFEANDDSRPCFATRAQAVQCLDRIARYAPTMTLRRAAKGW